MPNNMPQERVAKFEKVSFEQFYTDWKQFMDTTTPKDVVKKFWDQIELPKRATVGSAGYDFAAPFYFVVEPYDNKRIIPSGIRCNINTGWTLDLYPRSSYGIKKGIELCNTVGIIDEDYYFADNEGHILVALKNTGIEKLEVKTGDRFCQGIFHQYGITYGDDTTAVRKGGVGSTGK